MESINDKQLEELKLTYPIRSKVQLVSDGTFGVVYGTNNGDSDVSLLIKQDNGAIINVTNPDKDIIKIKEDNKIWICSYYLENDGDDTNITVWDNFNDAVNDMVKTLSKIYDLDLTINDFIEDFKNGYIISILAQCHMDFMDEYDRYAIIPCYKNSGEMVMP